jgi:hypothetical protein
MNDTTPRIPDDVLDELRWQADTPGAIVSMSKLTLRLLLDAYKSNLRTVTSVPCPRAGNAACSFGYCVVVEGRGCYLRDFNPPRNGSVLETGSER